MSFKKIKDNFDKIKELGKEYSDSDKEMIVLETKVKELKNKYKEKGVGKEVFSGYNKNLMELKENLDKAREKVAKLVEDINTDLQEELQDAIG